MASPAPGWFVWTKPQTKHGCLLSSKIVGGPRATRYTLHTLLPTTTPTLGYLSVACVPSHATFSKQKEERQTTGHDLEEL